MLWTKYEAPLMDARNEQIDGRGIPRSPSLFAIDEPTASTKMAHRQRRVYPFLREKISR
jgi:hypothetical protein